MTNQEAIELICRAQIPQGRRNGKFLLFEALNKAIYALDKQIPIKPKVQAHQVAENQKWFKVCSICKLKVNALQNFCPSCGQAIDWED